MVSLKSLRKIYNLDEAFLGDGKLKNAEKIVERIVDKVNKNNSINIHKEPEFKQLNDELKKVFGFDDFCIYWANDPWGGTKLSLKFDADTGELRGFGFNYGLGPYTMLSSSLFYNYDKKFTGKLINAKKGKGVYDDEHRLTCIVVFEQSYIYNGQLTAREVLAIILHEIGHNFDFSPMRLLGNWIMLILGVCTLQFIPILLNQILTYGKNKWSTVVLNEWHDMVAKAIPPIDWIRQTLGKATQPVISAVMPWIGTALSLPILPIKLLMAPLSYFINTFNRKGEEYADSFATTYGYGPELITGLDKLYNATSIGNQNIVNRKDIPKGLALIYDLQMVRSEFFSTITGHHGSNQQRALKQLYQLEKDLKTNNYPPTMKRSIQRELDEMKKVYNQMLHLNDNDRMVVTNSFRQLVDKWYDGKPYMNSIEKINMVE